MHITSERDGVLSATVKDELELHTALKSLLKNRRVYFTMDGGQRFVVNAEPDGRHLYQLPEMPRGGLQLTDRILNSLQQNADVYSVHALLMEMLANSDEPTRQFGRKLIRALRLNEPVGMR